MSQIFIQRGLLIDRGLMVEGKYTFDYQYLVKKFSCKKTLGASIREYLNEYGFIVLQNIEIDCDRDSAKLFLPRLCSFVGTLVPHNPNKKDFVWEIESKPSISSLKTFSEHNQHASLHTDSQYRELPEKFIALMTLRQATCGGGYTEVVDFQEVLKDLQSSALGTEVINFFRGESLPIAIPSIFQVGSRATHIISKLISENPLIRYRYDTLKAGLSLIEGHQVNVFQEKLDLFDSFIQLSPHRIRFLSSPGEIIFLDNHRFLHGRSSFTDLNRLLLRTRMN
jgi:alpha-ketoglutarate-dependent taurine dioxygenase